MQVMALGGHSTANMGGNIIPAEMSAFSKLRERFEDTVSFRETYLRVLPLLHFHYSAINPVAVKSLASALGLPAGPFRRPLQPLGPKALEVGLSIVRELGIAERYGYTPNVKRTLVAAG